MKNVFTLLSILTFVNVLNAQIDLKGYLEASYYQNEYTYEIDSTYEFIKSQTFSVNPTLGIAFNRKDKHFHQISLSNFERDVRDEILNRPNFLYIDRRVAITQLRFSYDYNFALWKQSEKWLPFLGIGTAVNIQHSNITDNNIISEFNFLDLSGQININLGLQYIVNKRFILELASNLSYYQYNFSRRSRSNQTSLNPTISYSTGFSKIANNVLFKNLPVRLGLVVRI